MRKTFQYKAVTSKTTSVNADRCLILCQQLYNLCLEQRIMVYNQRKITLSKYDQDKELPELKEAFPEFKIVGSQVLQDVTDRVSKAFQGFFRRLETKKGKAGFPRFKSRDRYDSFTLKQAGWSLEGKYLHIKGIGTFKLRLSRPIEGRIKTITLRRDSRDDWYVSFSCDDVPAREYPEPEEERTGIDVNISNYCTDSDPCSEAVENPRFYLKAQKQLRKQQRKVSRRKKGSNRRKKAVKQVARTHSKVSRQRKDFAHKWSRYYILKYYEIHIENLQIANMMRNHNLAKHIADVSWGMFFEFLSYKAAEAGRILIKVKPHGSSQECSFCHAIVPKTLAMRIHNCPECGLILPRDKNSANIIEEREGVIVTPQVGPVRPLRRKRDSAECAPIRG